MVVRMRGLHSIAWLVLLMGGCGAPSEPPSPLPRPSSPAEFGGDLLIGTVVSIADGDTLTLLDASKGQHKIRLEGIDCPERGQEFGTRARQALAEKVFQKDVRIRWDERDRYDRILGHVYLDDRWINHEMVQDGWAWHYHKYSDDEELAAAECAARSHKVGLWSAPNPIPPWDYRRGVRENGRSTRPTPTGSDEAVVYVTRTGTKYHRAECPHLSRSRIQMSLREARLRYEPCATCRP